MADNEAEPKAGGGLVKKLAIFGGGGILLIAIGLGAGYFIFGSAQPDPSEEIEEIIERKMREAEAGVTGVASPCSSAAASPGSSSPKSISRVERLRRPIERTFSWGAARSQEPDECDRDGNRQGRAFSFDRIRFGAKQPVAPTRMQMEVAEREVCSPA